MPITSVIAFGDSITEQGSSGLYVISGAGFWGQARAMSGSKWDPAVNGSVLEFASGGATTATLLTNHLAQVVASSGETVIDASGINDSIQSVSLATTLANRATLWEAALASGKQVIALAAIPVPSVFTGNGAGAVSARILAQNNAIRDLAASHRGVWYLDHTNDYHATPGAGDFVGNAAYTSDDLHPNSLGASILGRGLHLGLLALGFTYGVDPLAMGGTIVTPNGNFATGTTAPTGFTLFAPANAGAVGTHSMSTIDGLRWWRFPLNIGTSTSYWNAVNFNNNTVTPASKTHDVMCLMRVISGTVDNYGLTRAEVPSAQAAVDMSGNTTGRITAADGVVGLRTPKRLTGGSVTLSYPSLLLRPVGGDAVAEIAMLAVREFA